MRAREVKEFFATNRSRSLVPLAKLFARVANEGIDPASLNEHPQDFLEEVFYQVFEAFEAAALTHKESQSSKARRCSLTLNLTKAIARLSSDDARALEYD